MMWSWLIHLGEWWCFGIRVFCMQDVYVSCALCVVPESWVHHKKHLMKPASWPSNQLVDQPLLSSIVFCVLHADQPFAASLSHWDLMLMLPRCRNSNKNPPKRQMYRTPNLHPGLWSDPTGLCGKQVDSKLGLLWNGTRLLSTPCEGAVVGPKLQVQVGGKLLLVPWLGYEQWTMLTTSGSTWNVGTWRWASFFQKVLLRQDYGVFE